MGLDMYLYAERYVSGYRHQENDESSMLYTTLMGLLDMEHNEDSPHLEVKVCVGYWRKANAIHDWFVKNVQDGVDECQMSYVEPDKLRELRQTASDALAAYRAQDPTKAAEILPPTSGFFFGSTDVDEWYADNLARTIQIIDRALKVAESDAMVSLYYRSSW